MIPNGASPLCPEQIAFNILLMFAKHEFFKMKTQQLIPLIKLYVLPTVTLLLGIICFQAHGQETLCPDGMRSNVGVCREDGDNSKPPDKRIPIRLPSCPSFQWFTEWHMCHAREDLGDGLVIDADFVNGAIYDPSAPKVRRSAYTLIHKIEGKFDEGGLSLGGAMLFINFSELINDGEARKFKLLISSTKNVLYTLNERIGFGSVELPLNVQCKSRVFNIEGKVVGFLGSLDNGYPLNPLILPISENDANKIFKSGLLKIQRASTETVGLTLQITKVVDKILNNVCITDDRSDSGSLPVAVSKLLTSSTKAGPTAGSIIKDCAECPEMVVIPAGRFTMGSTVQPSIVGPKHEVQVPSFAAGRYSVTKGEFAAFERISGYSLKRQREHLCKPGFAQGDNHPVVCVTWEDSQAYIQWLSRISGKSYRLLSEAEREYVTRGGTQTAFWWGDTITTSMANYDGNQNINGSAKGQYRRATVPVNSFSANPFGLYNVHGNVSEWTQDCWHWNYSGAPSDGSAWTTGCRSDNDRVLRGGYSWNGGPSTSDTRTSIMSFIPLPSIGFRLARSFSTP